MEQQVREQAFISALTTEQFVLQAARSANVGEMTGRATVYMGAVSSSLIAFGFLAQVVTRLDPFVAAVLPAVFLLGEFTATSVQTGIAVTTFAGSPRLYFCDGAGRLLWGSNYPVSQEGSYADMAELGRRALPFLSATERDAFLAGTALSLWPRLQGTAQ